MPQDERGLYYPWYGTRYLLSRTRFKLTLPERSVYRDILDLIYEAGGAIDEDREYLCSFTGGTPEQIDRVLRVGGFAISDGKIRQRVADEVIRDMVDYRELGRRGGLKSAEARAAKYGTSNPAHEGGSEGGCVGGSEPPTKLKEGRKEGINKGSTPPAIVDNSPRPGQPTPGQVKTGFASETRKPKPPVKNLPPAPLTPERITLVLDGAPSKGPTDRDIRRPWLSRNFARWFDRQTFADQLALQAAYETRFGYGFDAGPDAQGVEGAENGGR